MRILLLLLLLTLPAAAQWRSETIMPDGGLILAFDIEGDTIVAGGHRMFRSTDRGVSWRELDFPRYSSIWQIRRSDSILFAVADSALWRSTDRGESWAAVVRRSRYGSGRVHTEPGGRVTFADNESGIHLSTDHGATWRVTGPHPDGDYPKSLERFGRRLYLGSFWGLYISTDDGASWDTVKMDPNGREVPQSFVMTPDGTLHAGCEGGYYVSLDSGYTWTRKNTGLGPGGRNMLSIAVHGDTVWAGLNGATIGYTSNRGERWDYLYIGTSAYNSVSQIERRGDTLWAATTGDGFYMSTNHGIRWTPRRDGMRAGMGIWGIYDFRTYALAATGAGLLKTTDGGVSWRHHDSVVLHRKFQRPESFYGMASLNDTVYAANYYDGFFRSADGGEVWERLELPGVASMNRSDYNTAIAFVGDTMLVSSLERGVVRYYRRWGNWLRADSNGGLRAWTITVHGDTVYAGGDEEIHRSDDRGRTWTKRSVGLAERPGIRAIAVTPSGVVYAHGQTPFGPMLYRSTNAGASWDSLRVDAAPSPSLHAGGFEVVGESVFIGLSDYDGLSRGVWRSNDRGETWENISGPELGRLNIQSLGRHGDRLLAGTQLYGIWRHALEGLVPSGIEEGWALPEWMDLW